jgi:hypothetical protein
MRVAVALKAVQQQRFRRQSCADVNFLNPSFVTIKM